MRRRFFIEQFSGQRAVMEGEAAHHLGRVLRAQAGQLYELSDGTRVWLGRIENVSPPLMFTTYVFLIPCSGFSSTSVCAPGDIGILMSGVVPRRRPPSVTRNSPPGHVPSPSGFTFRLRFRVFTVRTIDTDSRVGRHPGQLTTRKRPACRGSVAPGYLARTDPGALTS